jgi:serine/threonine protein phosphatase PrpC
MLYDYVALTDTGRMRNNNEDALSFDAENGLAILADGMGGYNAGEVASGMAISFITTELGRWLTETGAQTSGKEIRRAMENCVSDANSAIYNAACSNIDFAGMGTTLVVCVFQGARLVLGHIGDSRCYRWRHGTLAQLTRDHSLLQEQLDAGLITPAQAATSPNRNLVTRALGVEDGVMLEVNEHRVEPDDIYLMCSDGLSDMISDAAIASIFADNFPLVTLAANLIDSANTSGGRDNISVLLVNAAPGTKKRGFVSRLLGK